MAGGGARALKNFGLLSVAHVGVRILHLVLLAIIARSLGKEAVGGYATAIGVALYFFMLADLGVNPRLIREASALPSSAAAEYGRSLATKVALIPLNALCLGLLVPFLPYPDWVVELLVVFAIGSVVQSFCQLNESLLRSREKMHWEAISSLIQGVIFVGGSAYALLNEWSMVWVGWSRLAGVAVGFFGTLPVVAREIPILWRSLPSLSLLRSAFPYAATSLTAVAFGQIDIVIMSLMASQELVGEYASVSRLLVAGGAFAITGANTLLPGAARVFASGQRESFRYLMASTANLGALIGASITVGLALVGGPILTLIYGEEFANLETAFALGSAYVLLKTLTAIFGMGLTAAERQAARAKAVGVGLVATVILVALLVPPFGVLGAVGALVGSELVLAGSCLFAGRDTLVNSDSGVSALRLTFAMAVAFAVWTVNRDAGVVVLTLSCVASYAAALALTGELGSALRAFRRLAAGRAS